MQKGESQWPKSPDKMLQSYLSSEDPEVKKDGIVNTINIEEKSPTSKLIEYYSDWNSLKKGCSLDIEVKSIALGHYSKKKDDKF